jgi:WD40 repeat protein
MAVLRYDVFLSHASRDKPLVEELARRLERENLRPWLDKWNLIPGEPWQPAIEAALARCSTCAVVIGQGDFGPWHHEEMRLAISQRVSDRNQVFRVVPVLLPGIERPERSKLPGFLAATTWVEFRESLDDPVAFHQLICGIRGVEPGAGPGGAVFEDRCPYRGLELFDVEHAPLYFGREALTEWLLDALKCKPSGSMNRFLAIVGASGSGKSSLARAGLLAALKNGKLDGSASWPQAICRPGAEPLSSLATALTVVAPQPVAGAVFDRLQGRKDGERSLHVAARLVLGEPPRAERLIILMDQFEEVFALCADEAERRDLIANLLHAATVAGGRTVVVLAMRADFYPRCAAYGTLAAALSEHQVLVSPMTDDELRRAVEHPARLAGLEPESGLVELLVNDVRCRAGALPLLQFALQELWQRRQSHHLTIGAYRDIGKIEGALQRKADRVYAGFTPEQQQLCRRIFLRLVKPGDGSAYTRRRARLREVLPDDATRAEEVRAIIGRLADPDARLLTTQREQPNGGDGTLEVVHEALIDGWPLLRSWLDADRAGRSMLIDVADAASAWNLHSDDPGYLWSGGRLLTAKEWADANPAEVGHLEVAFLDASLAATRREEEERVRAIAMTEANERQKKWIRLLSAMTAAALLLIGLVYYFYSEADRSSVAAKEQTKKAEGAVKREAEQRQRAEGLAVKVGDRAVKLDLANGHRLLDAGDLSGALVWYADALTVSKGEPHREDANRRRLAVGLGLLPRLAHVWFHGGKVTDAQFSPNGATVVMADDAGTVTVRDVRSGETRHTLQHSARVNHAEFSPDGRRIVTASDDKTARVWDADTGLPLAGPLNHDGSVSHATFSHPDGRRIVTASDDKTARVWDADTGLPLTASLRHDGPSLRGNTEQLADYGNTEQLAGYGYDTARDISRVVTALSTVPSSLAGMKIAFGQRDGGEAARNVAKGLGVDLGDPTAVHLIGTFAINNFGGLGGGLGGERFADEEFADERVDGNPVRNPWSLDRKGQSSHLSTVPFSAPTVGRQSSPARKKELSVPYAAFSPDGLRIVTAGQDGTAREWDAKTGQGIGEPLRLPGPLTQAAFSPDGKLIVASDQGLVGAPVDPRFGQSNKKGNTLGVIKAWDAETRKEVWTSTEHKGEINRFSFGPQGQLVTASEDGTGRVWDLAKNSYEHLGIIKHDGPISVASFSPDGRFVATASSDQTVWVVDANTGRPVIPPLKHGDRVSCASFSPDGRWLLTAGDDGTARLWDLFPVLVVNHPPKQARGYRVATFSVDGCRLVLVNGDSTVWVCDALSGERSVPPFCPAAGVRAVWLAPDGGRLATAGEDRALQIWDADTGKSIARIPDVTAETNWPLFSPDGRLLITAGRDGVARLWDIDKTEVIADLEQADSAFEIAFSSDGRYLATTGKDNRIKIRNGADGSMMRTLHASLSSVCCLEFSPDGHRLLSSGFNKRLPVTLIWEIDRGEAPTALKGDSAVYRAKFSPNGRRLVTTGDEDTARVWDATTGEPVAQPLKHNGKVIRAEFSPDGLYIVTASWDQSVRVWDASLGEPLTPSLWHPIAPKSASFSADGRYVVSIDGGGVARVWDLTGERLPPKEQMTRIVELLGQNRIDVNSGVLIPLDAADYRENWQALAPKLIPETSANVTRESAWHWRQAEDSAEVGQWSAVLWHLDHLKEQATSTVLARRGDALRELGQLDKAVEDYDKAGKILPVDPALPWDRANLWRQRGDVLLKSNTPSWAGDAFLDKESVFMWPTWWERAKSVTQSLETVPVGSIAIRLMGLMKVQPVRRIPPLNRKKAEEVLACYQRCRQLLVTLPSSNPLTREGNRRLWFSYFKLALARRGWIPIRTTAISAEPIL